MHAINENINIAKSNVSLVESELIKKLIKIKYEILEREFPYIIGPYFGQAGEASKKINMNLLSG